ncbi:TPA: reverse transcriptase [Salmonella enterica]|uniref:Reverse transcriptase n=1 Tax=Salmonella enterica TaxID=28901 RepID=A0A760AES7_SALER|nr:reverse transcriptase [Salmonella enterica subsp. enterica serovar Bredeney]EBY2600127.1 reverse transcriptase [Salmonella enterica subsp. enterica serovar Bredeney]HAG2212686.1 reverse transcriptase [Salmonella enterica]
MQRKLATWAATAPSRRIERLLRLITQPEWLAEAARITLSSKGAQTPGVDGMNKAKLQAGLSAELQRLSEELLSGRYQPLPARRVYIPKSNGKLRPLGIPTIKDRVVQTAVLIVINPVLDTDLSPRQYGFRSHIDAKMAIRRVYFGISKRFAREVVDADLSDYFSTIPHGQLMKCLARRITDGSVLGIIRQWLRAPVVERTRQGVEIRTTVARNTHRGTAQGGLCSAEHKPPYEQCRIMHSVCL